MLQFQEVITKFLKQDLNAMGMMKWVKEINLAK